MTAPAIALRLFERLFGPFAREDWSFGNGEAPYLTMPKEAWK